jgi:hypothetical protein
LDSQLDPARDRNNAAWLIEFGAACESDRPVLALLFSAGRHPSGAASQGGGKAVGSLEDEIRRAREHANILAEEARVLMENVDERAAAANKRAKKARERLEELLRREQEGDEK